MGGSTHIHRLLSGPTGALRYLTIVRLIAYCGGIVRFGLNWDTALQPILGVGIAILGLTSAIVDLAGTYLRSPILTSSRWKTMIVYTDVVLISGMYACTGLPESDIHLYYYLPILMAAEHLPIRHIHQAWLMSAAFLASVILFLVVEGLPPAQMPVEDGLIRVLAPRELFLLLVWGVSSTFKRGHSAQIAREQHLADVVQNIPSASVLDRELDALLDKVIELGFDCALVGLVDDYMDTISIARARNVPPRQISMCNYNITDANDILADIVRRARHGDLEPLVFPAGQRDGRFNRRIYDDFEHANLSRAFLPLVTTTEGKLTVIGTLEYGSFGKQGYDSVVRQLPKVVELAKSHSAALGINRTHVLLASIAQRAADMIKADAASIHVFERGALRYQAGAGRATREFLTAFRPRGSPRAFGSRAIAECRTIIASESELAKHHPDLHRQGVRTLVAVPIPTLGSSSRTGVLYLHSWTTKRFTDADIELETLFAHQLGGIIQNYLLLSHAADAAERAWQVSVLQNSIQSLATSDAADITAEVAQHTLRYFPEAECVTLYEYFESDHRFAFPPIMGGEFRDREAMVGRVGRSDAEALWSLISSRSPRYAKDVFTEPSLCEPHQHPARRRFVVREGIRSSAQVPLRNQLGHAVGLLFINYRRDHEFSESERKAINSFAQAAAIAVQARREKDHKAQLHQIFANLNISFQLEDVAENILQQLTVFARFTSATLHLIRDDARVILKSRSERDGAAIPDALLPISQDTLIREVLQSQRARIVHDTSQLTSWHATSIRSWVGLPLMYADRPIGLVTLEHADRNAFQQLDVAQFEQYGKEAAAALYKAAEYREAHQHIRNLRLIRSVHEQSYARPKGLPLPQAVASKVGPLMNGDQCNVFLTSRSGDKVVLQPLGLHGKYSEKVRNRPELDPTLDNSSLPLKAFRDRRPLQSLTTLQHACGTGAEESERRRTPRSLIAAPITAASRNYGVITVEKDADGFFTENDLEALQQVALATATILERDGGLDLIQKVSGLVLEAKSVDEVLPRLLSLVVTSMDVDDAAIYLTDGPTAGDITRRFFSEGMDDLEPRPGGLTESIIEGQKLLCVEDTNDYSVGPSVRGKYQSLVGVPLSANDRVDGVLFVFSRTKRIFTDTELSVLQSLAGPAALGIHKTRRLERTLQRHDALHRLVALNALSSQLFHDIKSPISAFAADIDTIERGLATTWAVLEKARAASLTEELDHLLDVALSNRKPIQCALVAIQKGATDISAKTERISSLMDEVPQNAAVTPVDVNELLRRAFQKTQQQRGLNGIKVEQEFLDHKIEIAIHASIVVTALANIIANAVDAVSQPTGKVRLVAKSDTEGIRFAIEDNGRGIDEADKPHIFQLGYTKGKRGGSGYGLWFTKLVFDATGIVVSFRSKPGETKFEVTIPRRGYERGKVPPYTEPPVSGPRVINETHDKRVCDEQSTGSATRGG